MNQTLDLDFLKNSFPEGKLLSLMKGKSLSTTHQKIENIYWLIEGELTFTISPTSSEDLIELYSISKPFTSVGWSGFYPPQRFFMQIQVASSEARLFSVSLEEMLQGVSADVFKLICKSIYEQLQLTLHKQAELLYSKIPLRAVSLENYYVSADSTLEEKVALLRSSPFFGEFEEHPLKQLAERMERRDYEGNELIYNQDEDTQGLYILIEGEVALRRKEGQVQVELRSISTPGYIFGWSCLFDAHDISAAVTHHKTAVYFIPFSSLDEIVSKQTFYRDFYSTLIWLMGNHLQLASSRYVELISEHDRLSVDYLIESIRPKLGLSSPLHQIPHLLKDNATQPLAFDALHRLSKTGSPQERHLSSICLDLLKEEEKEAKFMGLIQKVYEEIAVNGSTRSHEENRSVCARLCKEVFQQLSYQIAGWENLPETSGNIFIYNHLINHPKYTLTNQFQLTLDSHFISAMILQEKYGDPGIRTVRVGKGSEYGHQDYYRHLGHINVYTNESEAQNEKQKTAFKERFYTKANNYLLEDYNLIISPEGTSFKTEESPGPFKMGPFNVATKAEKEPFIVPIAFVNFDRRIAETLFYCKILPPFKISETIKSDQTLRTFVDEYQTYFTEEVKTALKTADSLMIKSLNQ